MNFSERIAVLGTTRALGHGIDFQRSINMVTGIRNRFSAMHEFGHYELAYNDAPAITVVTASREVMELGPGGKWRSRPVEQPAISVLPADPAAPRFASFLHELNHLRLLKALRLSRDGTDDMMQQTLLQVMQPLSLTEQLVLQRASRTMRVRLHNCALFADNWVTYVSLMDNLLTRLHLEQALQLAAFRRPSAPTIVLVLLAVCRRYGHRAEPDDHSLVNRHQRTFRGAACTVS